MDMIILWFLRYSTPHVFAIWDKWVYFVNQVISIKSYFKNKSWLSFVMKYIVITSTKFYYIFYLDFFSDTRITKPMYSGTKSGYSSFTAYRMSFDVTKSLGIRYVYSEVILHSSSLLFVYTVKLLLFLWVQKKLLLNC